MLVGGLPGFVEFAEKELELESVIGYLNAQTAVMGLRGACALSLPFKTLDGRSVMVFVEPSIGNAMELVHDCGKTISFLEGSGLLVSEQKLAVLSDMARRLGASLDDGVFKILSPSHKVQEAVMSIAQCCCLAMYELLRHKPSFDEEQVGSRVGRIVEEWGANAGVEVRRNVKMTGSARQYSIDFVAETVRPIAVTVLIPSYGAAVSADRYALQSLDLQRDSKYSKMRKLAVISSPGKWKTRTLAVVRKFANEIAEDEEAEPLFPRVGIAQVLTALKVA